MVHITDVGGSILCDGQRRVGVAVGALLEEAPVLISSQLWELPRSKPKGKECKNGTSETRMTF